MPPKKPRSEEAQKHADALSKAGIKVRANASEKSLRAMAKVLNSNAPKGEHLAYINDAEAQQLKDAGGAGTTENNDAGVESYVQKKRGKMQASGKRGATSGSDTAKSDAEMLLEREVPMREDAAASYEPYTKQQLEQLAAENERLKAQVQSLHAQRYSDSSSGSSSGSSLMSQSPFSSDVEGTTGDPRFDFEISQAFDSMNLDLSGIDMDAESTATHSFIQQAQQAQDRQNYLQMHHNIQPQNVFQPPTAPVPDTPEVNVDMTDALTRRDIMRRWLKNMFVDFAERYGIPAARKAWSATTMIAPAGAVRLIESAAQSMATLQNEMIEEGLAPDIPEALADQTASRRSKLEYVFERTADILSLGFEKAMNSREALSAGGTMAAQMAAAKARELVANEMAQHFALGAGAGILAHLVRNTESGKRFESYLTSKSLPSLPSLPAPTASKPSTGIYLRGAQSTSAPAPALAPTPAPEPTPAPTPAPEPTPAPTPASPSLMPPPTAAQKELASDAGPKYTMRDPDMRIPVNVTSDMTKDPATDSGAVARGSPLTQLPPAAAQQELASGAGPKYTKRDPDMRIPVNVTSDMTKDPATDSGAVARGQGKEQAATAAPTPASTPAPAREIMSGSGDVSDDVRDIYEGNEETIDLDAPAQEPATQSDAQVAEPPAEPTGGSPAPAPPPDAQTKGGNKPAEPSAAPPTMFRPSGPPPSRREPQTLSIRQEIHAPGTNMFGTKSPFSFQQYQEAVGAATEHGNVLDEKSTAGTGPKSGGLVPIQYVQATRFFFRAPDYNELAKFYKDGDLDLTRAKQEFTQKKAQALIQSTVKKYGTTLMIRQAASKGGGEKEIYMDALECRQLMKALAVYQKETQGMYQAENTVTSAVDSAVDAIINGNAPGLYPYSSSSNGALIKHAKQPNEAKRPAIQGEFKMREKDRKRMKCFVPVNYA
jgi:hypothetical protein